MGDREPRRDIVGKAANKSWMREIIVGVVVAVVSGVILAWLGLDKRRAGPMETRPARPVVNSTPVAPVPDKRSSEPPPKTEFDEWYDQAVKNASGAKKNGGAPKAPLKGM
jgi:hypothetical protein